MTLAVPANSVGLRVNTSSDIRGVALAKGGRFRHLIRTRVSEHPLLYMPVARRKYPGASHSLFGTREYPGTSPEVVNSETEIVIDGYTRAATTFAVYAFQLAQDRPVRMAHHLHAPAQLIVAAKMRLPVLALIREPKGIILSQLVREPGISLRGALVAYSRFYSRLMRYRSRMVVGEFKEVTRDFGTVVRRVNERFGTDFVEFEHTENNVQECLDLVKERATSVLEWSTSLGRFESGLITRSDLLRAKEHFARQSGLVEPKGVWLPTAERSRLKEQLEDQWIDPTLTPLRMRAQRVYEAFVAGAEPDALS